MPYSSTAALLHKGTPAWVVFCEIADEQQRQFEREDVGSLKGRRPRSRFACARGARPGV